MNPCDEKLFCLLKAPQRAVGTAHSVTVGPACETPLVTERCSEAGLELVELRERS